MGPGELKKIESLDVVNTERHHLSTIFPDSFLLRGPSWSEANIVWAAQVGSGEGWAGRGGGMLGGGKGGGILSRPGDRRQRHMASWRREGRGRHQLAQ